MTFFKRILLNFSKTSFISASILSSFCWINSYNKIHNTIDISPENQRISQQSFDSTTHSQSRRKIQVFFTGTTSSSLALDVTQMLGVNLYNINVSKFTDGELNIRVDHSVRGREVFLFHSMSPPVNESLMELLLTIATLKNASAKQITAIIPYFGYSRQSMLNGSRSGNAAADIARMLEAMGVDKIITVDIHSEQIEGCFGRDVPIDNIDVIPTFAKYVKDNIHPKLEKRLVIASPDARGAPRAKKLQSLLENTYKIDCEVANLIRNRSKGNISGFDLIGNVVDADVLLIDDMIDTGDTLCIGAKHLKTHEKANSITAIATHGTFLGLIEELGIFSRNALTQIQNSYIDRVIVYDSIEPKGSENDYSKIQRATLAPLLAQTLSSFIRN